MDQTAPQPACLACGESLEHSPRFSGRDRLHGGPGTFDVATCAACGSGTTLPLLATDELGALYPTGYGPYADADGRITAALSRAIRAAQGRLALRRFPLTAVAGPVPGRGLDVGCGRGDLAALLASKGWSMAGIEPSPAACEAARSRNVDAREGTLATVAVEAAAYDLVVFQHSLEHTADPLGDLERTRTALRPGGVVAITVPNYDSWQRQRFGDRWYHLDLPRHRAHFSRAGLHRLLARAGLTVERTEDSTSTVGLPGTLQYRVAGRCLFPAGLKLRVAAGLCVLALPLARALDRRGGGDQLHVLASRPRA
jgi:SAM-dependent methyltransferase